MRRRRRPYRARERGSGPSSGERRRQGSITKAGSGHTRRLLVEAAHHYCRPPRIGKELRMRQAGQPAWVIEAAWRCQRRLFGRWQRLRVERAKRGGVVIVAIARAHHLLLGARVTD